MSFPGGRPSHLNPTPSVYRTRSHVLRRRALTGLAGVGLLLIGYGVGRWQDTPEPVAAPITATSVPVATSAPAPVVSAAATSSPPTPTVYPTLQAEAAALNGIQKQDTRDQGGGQNVGWIGNGDSMRYDGIDFGPVPATKLQVRVASDGGDGGRMEIRLDGPEQPVVGVLNVTDTGGWQDWRTDVVVLSVPVTGVHTVFLMFAKDDHDEFVNINWLQFQH